ERLEACAAILESSGETEAKARVRLRELLGAGNAELEKRSGLLRLFHARSRRELDALDRSVSASYQALLAVAAWLETPTPARAAAPYAAHLREHAATLRAGGIPRPSADANGDPPSTTGVPGKTHSPNPSGKAGPTTTSTQAETSGQIRVPDPTRTASHAETPGQIDASPHDAEGHTSDALALLDRSLRRLEGDASVHAGDRSPKPPFFAADAWSNPEYVRYALKTTLAAVICYVIYTGIDWQDIHTAMITCYIVALGSTGETVHKLTLRIIGCLIGATLGIGAVHLLIVPHMTGVGELMALVFVGCLLAAWVANGPERIAYAGVQIGLAFLMTVLQGFGPDPKIAIAVDRVAGIILGNVVTFIVFTQIWPVSVSQSIHRRLNDAGDQLRRLAVLPNWADRGRIGIAAELQQNMALARDTLPLAIFDPHGMRPTAEQWQDLRSAMDDATGLSATLAAHDMAAPEADAPNSPPALSPALQTRLARWPDPTPTNAHGQS
ncbi:MAG: FUSC family protein, partial [Pigmentiphaga sp.]